MKKSKIFIIGIGMGNRKMLTFEALEKVQSSELIIGAKRLIDVFYDSAAQKHAEIISKDIAAYIDVHAEFKQIAVLMSGDVGFYSGAKALLELLPNHEVELICGISSLVYFCAKCKTSWDDVKIVSLHGRENNICSAIMQNKKTFVLTGGDMSIKNICLELCEYGLSDVWVSAGENLSYDNERIMSGAASDFIHTDFDSLSVLLITNHSPLVKIFDVHGLEDDLFIRGEIPMTKSEVRSVSISKMQLNKTDIIYDIGAGTGSVSIETALIATEGIVYAIEKNEAAVKLIQANSEKFGTKNVKIIAGYAPEALTNLPRPDKAFIGGSSGNLAEIIEMLLNKNSDVRIVVNAIALETLAETIQAFQKYNLKNIDIVQLNISKAKILGSYHMMMGQNPITILSAGGHYNE